MSSSQIGFLVPLNRNLEEDASTPKLPVSTGSNIIGRSSVSISDKRLSRKHLTLIASRNGSADVVVEGTNPVVVASGNQRKNLRTGEKAIITNGDILELIPGHYFFKYVIIAREKCGEKANSVDALNAESNEGSLSRKRMRQVTEDEAFDRKLQAVMDNDALVEERSLVTVKSAGYSQASTASISSAHKDAEAIRHFSVPNDKLPLTFRLLRVKDLPAWTNTCSVSIRDVIQGDVLIAVLSNYMVDIDWLLSSCPILAKIPHVLVLHGEGDGTLDHMKKNKPPNWILHKPPLPISFGTHHSKAMLLVYPRGVRVIVHTANLIYVDWNNKSQGLWMQDFPWKIQKELSKGCAFENDLIDYLSVLKWPDFTVNLPTLGSCNINSSFFKKFDYSNAATFDPRFKEAARTLIPIPRPFLIEVRLIASVPGYHKGSNLKKWGHMKLRNVLQECIFEKEFQKSPLAYQFSSLGSLDEKWMTELASSMSSGSCDDKTLLGLSKPLIIWPTVEDVRCSLEGYAAGSAIPSSQKNVEKEFLKQYWAKWKATHTGHCRAMPHIKTYTRYNGQNLAWFLLTSANLSKAAWGALQKNNSQLMIRSYELGVLFLPSPVNSHGGFSCTDNVSQPKKECSVSVESKSKRTKLVTLNWEGNRSSDSSSESEVVVPLPVPYELPPKPYSSEDVPWSWDRRYFKKDVYGQVWPKTGSAV